MVAKNIILKTDFVNITIFRESPELIAFEFKILTSKILHVWIPGIGVDYLDLETLKDNNQKAKVLIPEKDFGYSYNSLGEIIGLNLRIEIWADTPEAFPWFKFDGHLSL